MENLFTILLGHYDNDLEALKADYKANGGYELASGGSFAIYYDDQRKELQDCGYNFDEFDDDEMYEIYCDLVVQALEENLG